MESARNGRTLDAKLCKDLARFNLFNKAYILELLVPVLEPKSKSLSQPTRV